MRIENVNVIKAHAFQRLITRRDHVFARPPFAVGAVPHVIARFGRNDQLIAQVFEIGFQDVAKGGFGAACRGAVIVGEVKMRDAIVKRRMADRAFGMVRGVMAKIVPQTEGYGGQHQARPAGTAVSHTVIAIFGRMVGHGLPFMAAGHLAPPTYEYLDEKEAARLDEAVPEVFEAFLAARARLRVSVFGKHIGGDGFQR